MSNTSRIEWTEHTWNPVTGCTKVSPGCKNCYALTMATRLKAMGAPGYERGFEVTLQPDRLTQPLSRRKPTMYFVNSMSDLFHESVPDGYINQVFEVIRQCPQHTFQILTKRAERMKDYFAAEAAPSNAWIGVSVEDRRYGKPRIPLLKSVDASVRFLSIEPLLEDLGELDLDGIHWVIVGGESGNQARPMSAPWVKGIQRQCHNAGVDFFFKQWGTIGQDGVKRSKKSNGRLLEGRTWDAIPAVQVI